MKQVMTEIRTHTIRIHGSSELGPWFLGSFRVLA